MPRNTHNLTEADSALLPRDLALAEFSRNLYNALAKSGWSQSELARNANLFLPEGHKTLGRDSISLYINGKTLPRPTILKALAEALKMRPDELMPQKVAPSVLTASNPPLDVKDAGNDTAWLRINQRVPWATALEIMQILKGAKSGKPDDT